MTSKEKLTYYPQIDIHYIFNKYAIENNTMVIWNDKYNIILQAERDISFEPILGVILDIAE